MKFLVYYSMACEFVHDGGKICNYGGHLIVEGVNVEEAIHKWWHFATSDLNDLLGDNSRDKWRLYRGGNGELYGYRDDDRWKGGVRVGILAIHLPTLSTSPCVLDTLNGNDGSSGLGERQRKPYGWWRGTKL